MSTYAQVSDLVAYMASSPNTPNELLQGLLDNAERDIDRLFNPDVLTDALMGLQMSGVTGGNFTASLPWLGNTFTSPPIAWNALGQDVVNALNAMQDGGGDAIRNPAWRVPQTPSSAPNWASGPFPLVPVVVEAVGYLGGQQLVPLVIASSLTGNTPSIKVVPFQGGGVRYDIWRLRPSQVMALKNATCAQAEYRDQMGEDFYVRAQWDSVHGPEFQTTGKLPMIGPKVHRELQGSGIVQYSARAVLGSRGNLATTFSRIGGTPIPDDAMTTQPIALLPVLVA